MKKEPNVGRQIHVVVENSTAVYYTDEPTHYSEHFHVLSKEGPVYVVVVNYDTGDSFSQTPNQCCLVDAFSDYELAKALVNAIHENYLESKDKYRDIRRVTYTNDFGEQQVCYTGTWTGYFERMNYVEVAAVAQKFRKYVH